MLHSLDISDSRKTELDRKASTIQRYWRKQHRTTLGKDEKSRRPSAAGDIAVIMHKRHTEEKDLFTRAQKQKKAQHPFSHCATLLKIVIGFVLIIVLGGAIYHAIEFEPSEDRINAAKVQLEQLEAYFNHNATVLNFIREHKDVLDKGTFENSWTYGGSVFFAFTIATTVGYGSFAPSTVGGQVFTVIYALVSIPVAGTILINTAATVLKLVTYLYTMSIDKVDKAFDALDEDGGGFLDHGEMRQGLKELGIRITDEEFNHLMDTIDGDNDNQIDKDEFKAAVTLLGADLSEVSGRSAQLQILLASFLIWLLLGSLYFSLSEEGWSYGHAVYFAFITLSTVGLGDYVPSSTANLIVLYLFTLVGLGMLAVLISLIREFAEAARKKADKVAHEMAEKADKKAHEIKEKADKKAHEMVVRANSVVNK
jgi:hypothetical protein